MVQKMITQAQIDKANNAATKAQNAYAAAKKSPTAKGGNVGGNTARSIGDRPPRSSVDSILKQYTP